MTMHNRSRHGATGLIELREAQPSDAEAAGLVMYRAFAAFHRSRGYEPDFPNVEAAIGLASAQIADPTVYGVVAVRDRVVVGSNFLTEGDAIRGVGPISVSPDVQGQGVGRKLMQAVIDRGANAVGIRLCQDAFNGLSLALYTELGFNAREPLALLSGRPKSGLMPGRDVRPLTAHDLDAADALAHRVTGFARGVDLRAALARGSAVAVEHGGRLAGYMTAPDFWLLNHAVAETEANMRALILGAASLTAAPVSFLLPIRNAGLFRWCLGQGFRVVKPMTLMSRGQYVEPEGGYLPSVMY